MLKEIATFPVIEHKESLTDNGTHEKQQHVSTVGQPDSVQGVGHVPGCSLSSSGQRVEAAIPVKEPEGGRVCVNDISYLKEQ